MFSHSPRRFHSLLIVPALLPFLLLFSFTSDNQPPVAVNDSIQVHGGTQLNIMGNDSDPDQDAIYFDRFGDYPQHGGFYGPSSPSPSYIPDSGYVGSDSFTYRIQDSNGAYSSYATVTLDVRNNVPTPGSHSYPVHGLTLFGTLADLMASDSDPDGDPISFDSIQTYPQHGTLTNQFLQYPGYTPNYGYTGPDSFTYRICDNLGLCANSTVTLNVVNGAPTPGTHAYPARGLTLFGTLNDLMASDSDPDGDPISFDSIQVYPQHGSLTNQFMQFPGYTPNAAFVGTDSFTYRTCDNLGKCADAVVTLNVMGDGGDDGPCDSCPCAVGEPINVSNGNMYVQQNDYQLSSIGPGLSLTRTYNSDSQRIGLFGRGWSTAFDESVLAYDSSTLRFNHGGGRAVYFGRPLNSSGAFTDLVGDVHEQISQGGSGFTLTMKDGSVEQFNSPGKLTSLADRNGNTTSLTYDSNGFLSSITDPFGRVLTVTTNANGQAMSINDTMGTVATYTYGGSNELLSVTYADNSAFNFVYDGSSQLTTVTDALGHIVESHTYDSEGRAITSEKQGGVDHYSLNYVSANETDVTDGLGRVTKYTFDTSKGRNVVTQVEGLCNCGGGTGSQIQTWAYDNQLNVTSKTDALGHVTSYTYDSNGNRLTETDATGTVTYTYNGLSEVLTRADQMNFVTTNTYDATGNLLSTTDAREKTTSFTKDARGLLLSVTDARGKVTGFNYDSSGNLITRTDALAHDTQFAYDARGRLTSTTNALGFTTSFAYDAFGRLNQVTQADGTRIGYEYDLAGRRTAMTDAKGNRSTFAYDAANRLITQTDALNQSTSYNYDAMSNLTSSTDALGRTTNYEYDDFSRLVKTTYPPATTGATRLFETIEYDSGGNVTKRIDTGGRATQYQYDALNRLASTIDAADQTTSFEYDALSRMTALVDAIGQRYRFNYNPVGAVTHVRRGTDVMTFTYDAVGNRKSRTDYNSAVTDYTYDALNRLKTITYPDTTTVNYTYDKLSRIQTAMNENGTVNFNYNKMNRVAAVTDVFGQVVGYNYDDNGNRTKLSLNAASVATHRYDAADRLTRILDAANAVFTFDYDPTSKLIQQKAPNSVKTAYQYDDLNRLTRITATKGAITVADFQYQFNDANNVAQVADPAGSHTYNYDLADRLTTATHSTISNESYSYDAVGNRKASQISSTYNYERFNRLVSTTTATYSYDANGNLTSKTDSSGATQYSWDFENRLKQVTLPNGNIISYKYDALGRRIERTGSLVSPVPLLSTTRFVYDGGEVIRDLDSSGATLADYINGPGSDNKLRQTNATTALYFVQDHLGGTRVLTNSLGAVVSNLNYDSFGNGAGSPLTRYGYTGRELDSDTGLYYYRARFFDPQVGRFISEDPIAFNGGQANLFAYVGNNPTNSVDPTGLWERKVHIRIIEETFKCLGESGLERLENSNDEVDGILNGGSWLEDLSYQHGMRAPYESVEQARRRTDGWISDHMGRAQALAPNGCRFGADNIPRQALEEFGLALHTIVDMTSPSHVGFQVWHGMPYLTGITAIDLYRYGKWKKEVYDPHHSQETLAVFESDPVRRKQIIDLARDAFRRAFGNCCCTR